MITPAGGLTRRLKRKVIVAAMGKVLEAKGSGCHLQRAGMGKAITGGE